MSQRSYIGPLPFGVAGLFCVEPFVCRVSQASSCNAAYLGDAFRPTGVRVVIQA
jgi:hypothetical protein